MSRHRTIFTLLALLTVAACLPATWSPAGEPAKAEKPAADPMLGNEAGDVRDANGNDVQDENDEKLRSLDIIIAEHVLMWDGEIMTWEQIIDRLRAIRKRQGKPIHPSFYATRKAITSGVEKKYHEALFAVYEELFQPLGVSFSSISPRAGGRYDAIRTAADLVPPLEQMRSGIVRSASGRPAWRATVVVIPDDALLPVILRPEMSLADPMALRHRHDEVWTMTDKDGRFRIAAPASGHRLAVISPQGFALVPVPKAGEPCQIELLPRSVIEIASAGGNPQTLDGMVHHPDYPKCGFRIYGIVGEKATIYLPPGQVTISSSFDTDQETPRSSSIGPFELKPAETKTLSLVPPAPTSIPPKK